MSDLPQAIAADPDGVQVALRAARTLWSRGDTTESLKWLRKAAESASDEGADLRSLQLAKAAAELRAKLFGSNEAQRTANSRGSVPPTAQGAGPFPPSGVAPGESGSHPIAQAHARSDSEPPRSSNLNANLSVTPSVDAFALPTASEDGSISSSRPVTATQYPSHRPRPRVGHLSSSPVSPRDGTAYAAVPSWSADSERRPSAAPPPLPRTSLDDYEELEAEPDEEPADDPGSVWTSGPHESWPPVEPRGSSAGATPPPLPPGGAFADDDGDFTQQSEAQTVVLPSLDEGDDERSLRDSRRTGAASSSRAYGGHVPSSQQSSNGQGDASYGAQSDSTFGARGDSTFGAEGDASYGAQEGDSTFGAQNDSAFGAENDSAFGVHREASYGAQSDAASFGVQNNAWDQQSRVPSWDHDAGSSWAVELHQATWGQSSTLGEQSTSLDTSSISNGTSSEPAPNDAVPQSEAARAKLTARVHHQAVRVSFAPDLRVPGQYVVRPLREGEKAATGERIALLVALEPGVPLV